MSDARHQSYHRHQSDGVNSSNRSSRASGRQQIVLQPTVYVPGGSGQQNALPATASTGLGSGRHSGSSHNGSSSTSFRGRIYDQYGRDHESTPSTQQSGSIPLVYRPSVQSSGQDEGPYARSIGAGSGGSFTQSVDPRSGAVSRAGSFQASSSERPTQGLYGAGIGHNFQQDIDERATIAYGPDSKSWKARQAQKQDVGGSVRRILKKSSEMVKEKLRSNKK